MYVVAQNSITELAQGTASTNGSQPDTLTVVAIGGDLYLYINKQYVEHVHDTTLNSVEIGVFSKDFNNPTEIAFSHAQVWQLAS